MHSFWSRANALFFSSLTAIAIMAGLMAVSTFTHESSPVLKTLELNKMESLRNYRDGIDRATLTFDIDADLSSVFNWNVKQLFVYVVAEYSSELNDLNRVVLWDKIIQSPEKASSISYSNQPIKYVLADETNQLRSANVSLRLEWDVMPVCGTLSVETSANAPSSFLLPDDYMGKPKRRSVH